MLHVTAIFAGILAFGYIFLSALVSMRRGPAKAAIGDGGNDKLARAIRVHGNFAEYIPFALLLMALNELRGMSYLLLIVIGCMLIISRISHAYSLLVAELQNPPKYTFRLLGMVPTFTVLAVLAFCLLLPK